MSTVLSSDAEIGALLKSARSIAVVGLSERRTRPSFGVAEYLIDSGYEVIPINPLLDNWQGIPAFPSIAATGRKIDLVDVFRRPAFVLDAVNDAILAKSGAIWTQLGVVNDEATRRSIEAGLPIVVDRCTAIEHRRLIAGTESSR